MITNKPLSQNFSLHELLVSETAARLGYDEQYDPSPGIVKNLEMLCVNVLQPLREAVKSSIKVNSGYRCERVNKLIGGASKSQHLTGHAADIQDLKNGNEFLLRKIVELDLPFDQVINEFGYKWVHVSFDSNRNRRQILEAVKENSMTVYKTLKLA